MNDLEQDSASDDRLRKWLLRTVEREPIDRFVIRHDTGAEVATVRADDGATFERTERQLDELVTELSERVFEDAIGLGGLQRYIISAYSGDRAVTRLPIRQNADASRGGPAPGDPLDSEPPTEKGLLSQTMRHLEISERTHATAIANIFAMQTRMLREKDERISHLEERHWETVVAAEQLVSDHHRRQLENRAADQKAEAMREVLGTFLQLAPTAVNKLAGRALLPEKTSPALVGLRALVGTLKAEQLEALKFVLTPAQLETFTEIVGSEVADEEHKRTAKP
ncbi:MAG TPA: hypothetical protein VKZ18_05500 [Polyangia bacterium]|nr:hypothetical protein [Polyangia bacterium]